MSRENVELVMSLYDAVQRREHESPFELIDEDILWDMSGFGLPDMAKVYRGHDGIREFWSSWLAAWETIEFKALAAEDYGDHVIVEVKQHNRGRESGVAVDFHYFQATTVCSSKYPLKRLSSPSMPKPALKLDLGKLDIGTVKSAAERVSVYGQQASDIAGAVEKTRKKNS